MMNRFSLMLVTIIFTGAALGCSVNSKENKVIPPIADETYKSSCGACHFAYQPALLPSAYWEKILESPDGHAGGNLSLEDKTKAEIKKYLAENSAERSTWDRAGKILDSKISDKPVRISGASYIKRKHWGVREKKFKRESVGSRGNCIACHRSAAKGIYDEDDVIIPD